MNPKEIDELREHYDKCMALAREWGMTPYETDFHIVPADKMYEIASYGIPGHFSHWTYGREYWKQKTSYDHGQSKIYELVINSNPAQAFLLETNSVLENKFVISHVIGHVHFFAANAYFADTNRHMEHSIVAASDRVRNYELKYGRYTVEQFIDDVITINGHIDANTRIKRKPKTYRTTYPMHKFIDLFPEEEREISALEDFEESMAGEVEEPEYDLLKVIMEHGRLRDWQREILAIMRDEAYYFLPQMQTKVINEGFACLRGDSLIPTSNGIMRADDLVQAKFDGKVFDGITLQNVTNWFEFPDRKIITLITKSGRQISGSENHRINDSGIWRRLDEFVVGDTVSYASSPDLWAEDIQPITWEHNHKETVKDWANRHGFSVITYWRYLNTADLVAEETRAKIDKALQDKPITGRIAGAVEIRVPDFMDDKFAYFLGLLVGDGHISSLGRCAGLTTGDEDLAHHFARLVDELFEIKATPKKVDDNKWRVLFYSMHLQDLLTSLGCKVGVSAREKCIPDIILKSPKHVVASFLRGLYDADGYAGKSGVILSTSSNVMAKQIQNVLWNFGIRSRLELQHHDIWNVASRGSAAAQFGDFIGFGLSRKMSALDKYLDDHKWFKSPRFDPVVEIRHEVGNVYDITVEGTHQYTAGGVLNHNSYIHRKMMHKLQPEEDPGGVDFASIHSRVLNNAASLRLNPYWLGYKVLERIFDRWENPNEDDQKLYGISGGEGWKKLLDIIEFENDVSLLRNYLDKELCEEMDLFAFAYEAKEKHWEITDKDHEKVRDIVVEQYANHGVPIIYASEWEHVLHLVHQHDGRDIHMNYAKKTLKSIRKLWGRPVRLETILNGKRAIFKVIDDEVEIETAI